MISVAPARRPARGFLDLVAGIPDHGIESAVISTHDFAKVGVELFQHKCGGDCHAHIILARRFSLARPADTDLDALHYHARFGYGVSGLVDIGQDIDLGLGAGSTNMAVLASISPLCDRSN